MESQVQASLLCAATVSCLASCAAMFDGTRDEVHFTSVPSGAKVIAGEQTGLTPVSLKLKKSTRSVRFVPPDGAVEASATRADAAPAAWAERDVELTRSFGAGWLFMDILFTPGFGLSGLLIDGGTSAWYELPGFVHCDFTKPPAEPAIARDDEARAPRDEAASRAGDS